MDTDQVNKLITDEIEEIEDTSVKKFIKDVLAHERKHIDRERYEYKSKYKNYLQKYSPEEKND
ncbi:hypothetical protein [Haloquadratum walsbyi]|jgi:hypothetical protein|uniref:Uncharacterized protein n=1 Tax=Haloquadratum walsbyi (strain DSM 16790 / HBSQ001) TaxID=362976 RepID=J7SBM9_HALWD|nr:hypothetical protein [Haloquadratum walsbyi]CCL97828.1 uncharacterized protein HQ_2079B [Haloquadratum walsbyi DSM 16790]